MKGGPGAHAWPTRDRSAAARGRTRRGSDHGASGATARCGGARRKTDTDTTHQSRAGPGPAVARPPATPPRTIVAGGISSAQRSCACRFSCPQSYQLLAPTNSWLLLFLVPPLVWLHSYIEACCSINGRWRGNWRLERACWASRSSKSDRNISSLLSLAHVPRE